MFNNKIPIYKPSISNKEKELVLDCLESSWISSKGRYISEFEEAFSSYLGVRSAVAVSNGTVALHLALLALNIKEGDEVLVPSLTYIASVNSISYTGATPIFVDSNMETWQMDPEDLESKITEKTKAIMLVHLYGHPCDMDKVLKIASKYSLYVIEDSAEAIGSKFNDKYVGTLGDIGTFSFFGNKTITTGEGGMVVSNNDIIIKSIKKLKGQGLADKREYWHDIIGYNYRMTNICAAIGLAQLDRIESFLSRKYEIAQLYKRLLSETPIEIHKEVGNVYHSYWMVSILVNSSKIRKELREYLTKNGVETRPVFYPIHTMPIYSKYRNENPIAENIGSRGINLPSFPDLNDDEIKFICNKIKEYFSDN